MTNSFQPSTNIDANLKTALETLFKKVYELEKNGGGTNTTSIIAGGGGSGGSGGVTAHRFDNTSIHDGFSAWLNQYLKTTDDVTFNNVTAGKFDIGSKFDLVSIIIPRTKESTVVTSEELWLLSNATYSSGGFSKIDITKVAFGLQIQASGCIPGLENTDSDNQGFVVWRSLPDGNSVIVWTALLTIDSNMTEIVSNATHTGDVTGATALTIADKAVTLTKMADMATASIVYRKTAGVGVPEVQSLATLRTDLNISDVNIDGGFANSVYLATQLIDGGGA